jgi:hypothetical protein
MQAYKDKGRAGTFRWTPGRHASPEAENETVGHSMSLMRLLATRVVTILLYTGSVVTLPAVYPSSCRVPASSCTASCAMCKTAGAGHQCSCCSKGDACTCRLSSGNPDQPMPLTVKAGLPSAYVWVRVALASAPLRLAAQPSSFEPWLPVHTPPPKTHCS